MEEEELLESLRHGNKEAFTSLYKSYCIEVYNFSRLYLNTKDAAEEVVQEVFIKLWENRVFIKPGENFKGFLFIITRNIIFNNFRKNLNLAHYKISLLTAIEEEPYDMEAEIDASNLKEYIDTLIKEMPEQRQIIFNLSRNNGLSYKEIAQQLNITERMVERHLNKAIKFLRQNIYLFTVFLSGFDH